MIDGRKPERITELVQNWQYYWDQSNLIIHLLYVIVLGEVRNMGEETQDSSLSKLDSSQLEMMKEMCLVVDENDKIIDSSSKIDCHRGKGIRHRAFSVLILILKIGS